MKPTISIVIVNYQTAAMVCDCLHSLIPQIHGIGQIIIVDNASGDDSVEKLNAFIANCGLARVCRVLSNDFNGGFSYGNNSGIRLALAVMTPPDYLFLLNPDTLVSPGAIAQLLQFMHSHPKVGIAGSRLLNADGGIECSAHVFPSPLGELEGGARLGILSKLLRRHVVPIAPRQIEHPCDWVSGASMVVRRQVFEDIGLLDEGYFLYFEEVDFCHRSKNADWECWHVPGAHVVHLEGAATGITQAAKRRPAYWYNSRRRYFVKHHGVGGLILADILWSLGRISYLLRRLLHLGAQGAYRDPKWFMFDLLWGDLRGLTNIMTWRIHRE